MTINHPEGQFLPEEGIDVVDALIGRKVQATAKALDDNTSVIHRWFWKGFIAFNLVLWSVALAATFVLRFG